MPAGDEAPAPAPPAPAAYAPPATWPGNVPSQAQALEVLRGRLKLAVSLPSAHLLQEKLTHPEREALQVEGMADALCEALGVRWRLAAARDLLLTSEGQVDRVALEALLSEVEQALDALRATEVASPELALAVDRVWETLAEEAVEFTSKARSAPPPPEARPAPPPAKPKKAAAPTKVKFTQQGPEQGTPPKKRVLSIALALVVLAAGAYHATSLLGASERESNYPGAPPNTLVIPDKATGVMMVRSMLNGPASPEQQAWLARLKAQGMQIKQVGTATYLVTPAAKTPATAGHTTP